MNVEIVYKVERGSTVFRDMIHCHVYQYFKRSITRIVRFDARNYARRSVISNFFGRKPTDIKLTWTNDAVAIIEATSKSYDIVVNSEDSNSSAEKLG